MSEKSREDDERMGKIMGSYLLKGYTLLDDYCRLCQTPLMKSRNSQKFCIYCNEICDNSAQISIKQSDETNVCEMVDVNEENKITQIMDEIPIESINLFNSELKQNIETSLVIIQRKLKWATNRLNFSDKVGDCIQLTNLIKSCADTIQSLRKIINDSNEQN